MSIEYPIISNSTSCICLYMPTLSACFYYVHVVGYVRCEYAFVICICVLWVNCIARKRVVGSSICCDYKHVVFSRMVFCGGRTWCEQCVYVYTCVCVSTIRVVSITCDVSMCVLSICVWIWNMSIYKHDLLVDANMITEFLLRKC